MFPRSAPEDRLVVVPSETQHDEQSLFDAALKRKAVMCTGALTPAEAAVFRNCSIWMLVLDASRHFSGRLLYTRVNHLKHPFIFNQGKGLGNENDLDMFTTSMVPMLPLKRGLGGVCLASSLLCSWAIWDHQTRSHLPARGTFAPSCSACSVPHANVQKPARENNNRKCDPRQGPILSLYHTIITHLLGAVGDG